MEDPDADHTDEPIPPRPIHTGLAGETTGAFPAAPGDASDPEATVITPAPRYETIGDFEIISKLGQGGMGAVYRARQISLDRQVALKILPATLEADADFVSRFQREARIAASLNHANLVKVYASGLADGCHFIAMELIEGETLGQLIRRGPLSPPEALRICLDVARALQCGWDRAQLIHRDIKPGNIFLSSRGEVKVGDLGLAKSMAGDTTGLTNTGTAMGTPHYISPEQARGEKDLDCRADIYSLGCTLYQMLTGRTPYAGSDPVSVMHQHIHGPPPAILKVMPGCPIPLARLVGKMLKKIRRERQAGYEELIGEIQRVQALYAPAESALEATMAPHAEEPALERTPSAQPQPATSPRTAAVAAKKNPLVLVGGIAAGVVVLGFGSFFLLRAPSTKAPSAAATPSPADAIRRASKATPFVNSLGMRFVPVPIPGGPTKGQRLLFSIWETRLQDYDAFVAETKTPRVKGKFEQGPTEPAGNVSWDDAMAFCEWLTQREHQAGHLDAGHRYRLPSDYEWSCLVSLGDKEDPNVPAKEKSGKYTDQFPWGADWPPPTGFGNYKGSEQKGGIEGYRDDFVNTAPVGSFPADRFGLYDVSGNVWEWCIDESSENESSRELRGGSHAFASRNMLQSTARPRLGRNYRSGEQNGFRVVLAPETAVPAPGGATGR